MEERRNQRQGRPQQPQGQGAARQPQQSQSGARQQGGQSGAGQQRQFDTQGSAQQSGDSGTKGRFIDQIREHMEVVDAEGKHCGTVDHLDGDRIKLARSDSKDGQHHYVPMSQVAGIDGNKVRLRTRGDNAFGMEAKN